MPLFKGTFTAQVEIDVWLEADSLDHAEVLIQANDRDTYPRIRSSVSLETGSIRINTPSISVQSIEEVAE